MKIFRLPSPPSRYDPEHQSKMVTAIESALTDVSHPDANAHTWAKTQTFKGGITLPSTKLAAGNSFTPAYGSSRFVFPVNAATDTINAPTGMPATGAVWFTVTIQNTTAGAITTTWNAAYHLAAAWVDPAPGKQRTVLFEYDGASGIAYEFSRSPGDVTT